MKKEDVYDKYSTEQIDEFEEIAEKKCCYDCFGCEKSKLECSDCDVFYRERDEIVLLDYIEYLEKERNEKDKQIEILEKALCNTCYLLYGTNDEHYPNWFKKQAKKELGEE